MNRRLAREVVMIALFQMELGQLTPEKAWQRTLDLRPLEGGLLPFGEKLFWGVVGVRDELDAMISRYSPDWSLGRMGNVDRNLLRLGLYEILHEADIPLGVSIDEMVELAKVYGDDQSPKFINGILGNIVRSEPSLQGTKDE